MKSVSFRKDLVGVQDELLRFAYKLTTDREEANDLLQETSLKALDNEDKYQPDTNFNGWMYTSGIPAKTGVGGGNGNKKGKKGLFPSCLWLFADNWQLIVI